MDDADCLDVQHRGMSGGSAICCVMVARQDGIVTKEGDTTATRSDLKRKVRKPVLELTIFDNRQDPDPFLDKSSFTQFTPMNMSMSHKLSRRWSSRQR